MIRLARRAAAFCLALYLAGFAGTAAFVLLYERPSSLPADSVIVVLGGGIRADGRIGAASAERVAAAVALHASGIGDGMVMTGGTQPGGPGPVAIPMADAARAAGVPVDAIQVETRSLSTLQNALLSRPMIASGAPVILVTNRFHLARAWASFRWAGFRDLHPYAAEDGPVRWNARMVRRLASEALKWPVNGIRAGLATGLDAIGVPVTSYLPLLD